MNNLSQRSGDPLPTSWRRGDPLPTIPSWEQFQVRTFLMQNKLSTAGAIQVSSGAIVSDSRDRQIIAILLPRLIGMY